MQFNFDFEAGPGKMVGRPSSLADSFEMRNIGRDSDLLISGLRFLISSHIRFPIARFLTNKEGASDAWKIFLFCVLSVL